MKNTAKKTAALILLALLSFITQAQIGIGTITPDKSAAVDIADSTKGLLIPRMTAAQRLAILNPAKGLMVYQTDNAEGFWFFGNQQWKSMISQNNGGKQTLLTGNITNAEAQVKIAAEAGPNTQIIRIVNCTQLTSADLSSITGGVTQVLINNNTALQTVNLGNVPFIDEGIYVGNSPKLSTLNLCSVKRISPSSEEAVKFIGCG